MRKERERGRDREREGEREREREREREHGMEKARDTQVFRKSELYPDRDRYSKKKYQKSAGQRLKKEGKRERERNRERKIGRAWNGNS